MITKEEIDMLERIHESILQQNTATQAEVNFLIELKREAHKIEDECIAVLEMIRRR